MNNQTNSLDSSNKQEDLLKEKTLKYSIIEGSFANISLVISDNFTIPFALALNISRELIGTMVSAQTLFGPISQIIGSHAMEKFSRKHILTYGVFFQSICWLLYLILTIFFSKSMLLNIIPYLLILFYLLFIYWGNFVSPSWISEMGDIVHENSRGKYFSKRNIITTFFALIAILILSYFLDYFKMKNNLIFGFQLNFLIAFICRFNSMIFLRKHYFPKLILNNDKKISLLKFIKNIYKENFGRFCLLVAMVNFGQMIAGPFFSVYMLKELKFIYVDYILTNVCFQIFSIFIFRIIGTYGDKFGNVKLMRMGAIAIPIIPILWLFTVTPLQVILLPQLLGSFGWTAFNLAASNFIYDSIPQKERGYYTAYYNFIIGISMFSGGMIGSYLMSLNIQFVNPYHLLFFLSGIVRAIFIIILLPSIKEVRQIMKIKHSISFHSINSNIQNWFNGFIGKNKKKNNNNK